MHFELRRIEESCALALCIDANHLAAVACTDKDRTVSSGQQRPKERRGGLVNQIGRGPEHKLAAAVEREVLDVPFEELGRRRRLKELGRRGVERKYGELNDRGSSERAPHG